MKRSTSLSVFLVALTAASAAAAAPDNAPAQAPAATPAGKTVRVAQADPTGAPGSSPTAAPANADGTESQPAVTVGTSTAAPGTDTPAEAPPEEEKPKPKPRPFAGSSFYTQTSMTLGTVFAGMQQDYNPTVATNFWLLPRYAINDAFQLRGRLIIDYEYTNSDSTVARNEPVVSDTTISLFYRKLPHLPGGIIPNVAVNVGLPTSKLSRSRTMIFTPGATLQLAKPLEHILGGEGLLLGSVIFSHPIYRSTTAEVADPRPAGAVSCAGGSGDCNNLQTGGTLNPANTLSYFLLYEMEWGKWSPAIYYLGSSQWVYAPTEVRNPVDGRPVESSTAVGDPSRTRQAHYFSVWLDYNFNSWFTGEVGYIHSRSALNGAGNYGNPFFDVYTDTRAYLGASIQLDNLVKTLQGGSEGEAGIVRAKNTKQPMWNF